MIRHFEDISVFVCNFTYMADYVCEKEKKKRREKLA